MENLEKVCDFFKNIEILEKWNETWERAGLRHSAIHTERRR